MIASAFVEVGPDSNPLCLEGADSQFDLMQDLIAQIPDFLFVKDVTGRFLFANDAITRAYGLPPNGLLGKTDYDLHPPLKAEEFFRHEQAVMRTGVPMMNMEESFPDHAAVPRWYSTTKVPRRDAKGTTVGVIGIGRDITHRKQIESFSLRQSAILEMIAQNAPLTVVLTELALLIESQVKGVKSSVLLYDAETECLRHGAAPRLPDDYNRALDGLRIGSKVGSCGTAAHRRASVIVSDIMSDPLWEDYRDLAARYALRACWSTPILSHAGAVLGTFAVYADEIRSPVSSEKDLIETVTRLAGIAIARYQSEQQLVHMAHYDALTGLPNRVLCLDRLKAALRFPRSGNHRVALLYIDLDGFKQVNDQLGHYAGDVLLGQVGQRLRAVVAPEHTVARLGGDEFAIIQLVPLNDARRESAGVAARIVKALSQCYTIGTHQVVVGATVGVAIAPDDDDNADALMRDADLALYRAKADERGCVRFFEPAMSIAAQQRRTLEADLRRALGAGEFELYYQAQIELATNEVCGFEALLRWNHPIRGLVPPLEFITVAEEIGLIVPIGKWVLQEACMQAARWPSRIKIAVNLSPVQFSHKGLFAAVMSALSLSCLLPERLELEITESVILLDNEVNRAILHQIRALGVQVSLDDFGTGYSSLSYLRSFPFTKIKIDRSFVRDLDVNPGCFSIIRAISRLASDLGMKTIAEGIETREQLVQLRGEGCDEGQGYFFSRPVPAGEATALLDQVSSAVA